LYPAFRLQIPVLLVFGSATIFDLQSGYLTSVEFGFA
jgi:hypothetical protein